MWEEFIHDNIAPLVSNHWGSYKTKGINIAFVIKYDSEKYTIRVLGKSILGKPDNLCSGKL